MMFEALPFLHRRRPKRRELVIHDHWAGYDAGGLTDADREIRKLREACRLFRANGVPRDDTIAVAAWKLAVELSATAE